MVKQKLGIHHGLTLVRREKKYYDMIAFAMSKPIDNPHGYYLNILNELEYFISQFEIAESSSIEKIEKDKIVLPTVHQDVNHHKLCLSKGRIEIINNSIDSYITLQECHCIKAFQKGLSVKEVARKLKISPRTVETYTQRVLHRTGLPYTHPLFLSL